jgi:DUF1680 family protein
MTAPAFRMRPLGLTDVTVDDRFWRPRIETNRSVTVPIEYEQCRKTQRIKALKLGWKPGMPNQPHHFWDSDIAKWIEAAGYCLAATPDRKLERLCDRVIDSIEAAQQPDGYFNIRFTVVDPQNRWKNLRDCHELYCAGHLMEGAVAYYEATGKRKLLDAMCRYADYIGKVFGPRRGQKRGYPGHEEAELALVKLYHATGERRYLKLSKYFVDERGRRPHYYDIEAKARGDDLSKYWAGTHEYTQSHLPVREQTEVVGHAVRAFYLYSGMADIAGETGDAELLAACRRLWADAAEHKLYVTGGVGPSHRNEGFTRKYDLPNESAYAETCAAIALVFFAHRMTQIEADAKYADVMERALYNGTISGVSQDGTRFFYENPLAAAPPVGAAAREPRRREWFGCACCPPNIARMIASLPQYACSASASAAYVHLYLASTAGVEIGGRKLALSQQTDYPWDGEVKLTVGLDRPGTFALMLRIPGWCRRYKLTVNGKRLKAPVVKGYARIRRPWADGDVVTLLMDMPIERIVAHPGVTADSGKVALQRGPLVYCLEQVDHAADVRAISLPDKAALTSRFDRKLLGGVVVIEAAGLAPAPAGWKGKLYRTAADQKHEPVKIKAVPYCLWDNRRPGAMTVWLPRA